MVAPELYPFSTQDGKAIPLEVVKPTSHIWWALVDATEKSIVIPDGFVTGYCYATCNCILRNENTTMGALPEDTLVTGALFIPANTLMTVNLAAGAGKIYPLDDGALYLSVVQQWAALNQTTQASIG